MIKDNLVLGLVKDLEGLPFGQENHCWLRKGHNATNTSFPQAFVRLLY